MTIGVSNAPYFEPGKGYHYSNTNTILLGIIIQQITHTTLEQEMQNRIITPLGLKNTSFPTSPDLPVQYSHGYSNPDNTGNLSDATWTDPSCGWAAGAMVSNLDDIFIWAKALAEGELLSAKTQKERLTGSGYDAGDPLARYCLGVYYIGNFLGHNGEIRGYNNCMYYLPSRKATFIVFSNNGSGADSIFCGLSKVVVPDDVSW